MRRRRVGALTELQQRARLHLRAELDDADERRAGDAVATLLALFGPRIEVVDDADGAGRSGYGQARLAVVERLKLAARLDALQAVDLAPGDAPRAPVSREVAHHRLKRDDAQPLAFRVLRARPQITVEPHREQRHLRRVECR